MAFIGFDSVTVNVSSCSSIASSTTPIQNTSRSDPGLKVTVPVAGPARSAADAVSVPSMIEVAQSTVTSLPLAAESCTTKATRPSFCARLPRLTLTSGGSSPSAIDTVAATTLPAVAPSGSVPNDSATLSAPSSRSSSIAVSVKLCAVSPAAKLTLAGTPDQSARCAPPAPAAEIGTSTAARPDAADSSTVTATDSPSATA